MLLSDGKLTVACVTSATVSIRPLAKPLETWCVCSYCCLEPLVGSREFQCCHEVAEAYGKVVFNGLTDTHVSIIQHEDFVALVNATNLKMVATLLKDRHGKNYRKKHDQSENEKVS